MISSKKVKKAKKSKKTVKKTIKFRASQGAEKNKKNWLAERLVYYLKKIEAI